VRTRFLLQWILDDSLSHVVHKGTTKIERHRRFATYLASGGEGLLWTYDPADQEKATNYNELLANAMALQNVVDQTQALQAFKSEGARIKHAALGFLSPCARGKLKHFRDDAADLEPDPLPMTEAVPA
jgi:hypothetical protein